MNRLMRLGFLIVVVAGIAACQPPADTRQPDESPTPSRQRPLDAPIRAEDLPPDDAIPAEEEVPDEAGSTQDQPLTTPPG